LDELDKFLAGNGYILECARSSRCFNPQHLVGIGNVQVLQTTPTNVDVDDLANATDRVLAHMTPVQAKQVLERLQLHNRRGCMVPRNETKYHDDAGYVKLHHIYFNKKRVHLFAHRVAMVAAGFKDELLKRAPRVSNGDERLSTCSHLCHTPNCQKADGHLILETLTENLLRNPCHGAFNVEVTTNGIVVARYSACMHGYNNRTCLLRTIVIETSGELLREYGPPQSYGEENLPYEIREID
jgi:hypothetical protein